MKTKLHEVSKKEFSLPRILPVLIALFILVSCNSEKHFMLSHTSPKTLPEKVTGAFTIVYPVIEKDRPLRGELIAVKGQAIILHSDTGLIEIPLESCSHIKLLISKSVNNRATLTAWAVILPFSTVIHGLLLAFTFPLNVAVVAPTIIAIHSNYKASYPKQIGIEELAKFARFPQGLPEGLTRNSLK